MLSIKHVAVNGVRSAVHDTEPGAGAEAVVFVHGNPGPMDDFEELVPQVAALMRTVAVDLPGFGRADHPWRFDFSVTGYAQHLAGVLDQIGVTRAHLVLHDFGGPFGLRFAASHPKRVASLTLINTGFMQGYRWHKYARIWQTPVLGELFQLLSAPAVLKRALDGDNPVPLPQSYIERVFRYADWAHRRAVLKLYRATRDPDVHFAKFGPELRRLDVPVCVIWGDGDPYIPVRFAEQQREAFPRAEVHVLKGLGHWPFIDDPAAVLQHLVPFLQRQLSHTKPPSPSATHN